MRLRWGKCWTLDPSLLKKHAYGIGGGNSIDIVLNTAPKTSTVFTSGNIIKLIDKIMNYIFNYLPTPHHAPSHYRAKAKALEN